MRFDGRTVVCIGTGPSLTMDQVGVARRKGFALCGINNVWLDVPDLALLWATNGAWWNCYWSPRLRDYPAEKWTVCREAADRYGLNWTAEKDAPGLSQDPGVIHHGHGGGYSLLNLVYLLGAARVVLLGYDLKYAPDYDGRSFRAGSTPRHYFGEYPSELMHWPRVHVRDGVHYELVRRYGEVAEQGLVEVLNCTPGSALTCFPSVAIDEVRDTCSQ